MQLNNTEIIDRHNRPNTTQRVGLRTFFINDGVFVNPYQISSVSIFLENDNTSPSTLLDSDTNLLKSPSSLSSVIKMNFQNSATPTADVAFASSSYPSGGAATADGIYKGSQTGEFVVVLDGTLALSGEYNEVALANAASAVNNYIDVWTVKMSEDSDYQVLINEFRLYNDTFFTTTQPLLINTHNYLQPKHVVLGSKIDLKIPTEISLGNKDIDQGMLNIFKDSVITSATITIKKLNEDPTLDARVTVVSGSSCDITSDNTLIYSWDTSDISTSGITSYIGVYTVQAEYTILNQRIVTPQFNLIMT